MTPKPTRILFVCTGNICRSPLAEGVFRHFVRVAGIENRFEIDSAGTSGYHAGDPPDARSTATARARGIELMGRSRQLTSRDLHRFDYVIVMDEEHREAVLSMSRRFGGSARVRLLREWDPEGRGESVPDPYYGGINGFEDVQDMVERACANLLDELLDGRRSEP
jgi:protein-tyrosine phosphatase